jgi:DNA (cytosine-5)-methyltransferase 1
MTYRVVDLFCGVGGLSYGFAHDDDFVILAANEILPNMAKAYSLNHPHTKVYVKDIKHFGVDDLIKDFQVSQVDVLIGGPPCQAYSTSGKRAENDPRAVLFHEYFRLVKELNPKLFLFENVKGLISIQGGKILAEIISKAEELGYMTSYQLLKATDFGSPQIRERIFLVGSKKPFLFPSPTHTKAITLSEALSDLPLVKSGEVAYQYATPPQNEYQKVMRKNAPSLLLDQEAPRHNSNFISYMKALPIGGSRKDVPSADDLIGKSFPNGYARLWWDRPCSTITRNFGTPSSARCIHPLVERALTTREGARIQGFPDDYVFCGSRSEKNLQIGNAVPTQISIAFTDAIKRHLQNIS